MSFYIHWYLISSYSYIKKVACFNGISRSIQPRGSHTLSRTWWSTWHQTQHVDRSTQNKQDRVKCYQTKYALQGTNISHPRKRELIDSKYLDKGDMLVPWTVFQMKRDWNFLVGGINQWKKICNRQIGNHFPNNRDEHEKSLSCHHPVSILSLLPSNVTTIPPHIHHFPAPRWHLLLEPCSVDGGLLWWYSECISRPKDTNLIVSFGGILWTWCVCSKRKTFWKVGIFTLVNI